MGASPYASFEAQSLEVMASAPLLPRLVELAASASVVDRDVRVPVPHGDPQEDARYGAGLDLAVSLLRPRLLSEEERTRGEAFQRLRNWVQQDAALRAGAVRAALGLLTIEGEPPPWSLHLALLDAGLLENDLWLPPLKRTGTQWRAPSRTTGGRS